MKSLEQNATQPIIEIDGSSFQNLEEFWDEVSRELVPDFNWGRNLDAFRDILCGGFGTPEGGFELRWLNAEVSRASLGYPETVRQLEIRLRKCHPANRNHVREELEAAERGEGPTVFDWLVEIIGNEPSVKLILA